MRVTSRFGAQPRREQSPGGRAGGLTRAIRLSCRAPRAGASSTAKRRSSFDHEVRFKADNGAAIAVAAVLASVSRTFLTPHR
jgi:hypothetical protein